MNNREVMQQALEALEGFAYHGRSEVWTQAMTALRARLAEPEPVAEDNLPPMPDPVAWQLIDRLGKERNAPLFAEWQMRSYARVAVDLAAPPARRPLTDEEIDAITRDRWGTQLLGVMVDAHREYARAIERKITGGNDERA